MMCEASAKINKTREFLKHIEQHRIDVSAVWVDVKKEWTQVDSLISPTAIRLLDMEIAKHDISKLNHVEFIPYRMKFFPTAYERESKSEQIETVFQVAHRHHLLVNKHHIEYWVDRTCDLRDVEGATMHLKSNIVHTCVDWIAYKLAHPEAQSPLDYLDKRASELGLHIWVIEYMERIFRAYYRGF